MKNLLPFMFLFREYHPTQIPSPDTDPKKYSIMKKFLLHLTFTIFLHCWFSKGWPPPPSPDKEDDYK